MKKNLLSILPSKLKQNEISEEPLIELHIPDEDYYFGIKDLEVKIDLDTRNESDSLQMKFDKIPVWVNRGQYDFKVTNGLLEMTHN